MPVRKRIKNKLRRLIAVLALAFAAVLALSTPAFADATPILKGSDWFGGGGSNVCSNANGGGSQTTCGGETHVGGSAAYGYWQCVELAQRFYKHEGWYSGIFPGVDYAYQIYSPAAAAMGMSTQANGNITSLVPGDMVIHGANDKYSPGAGHVAIVDHISGSTVYAVQQNAPDTTTYTLSNKTLSGGSGNDILGIVHSPKNGNTNGGASQTPATSPAPSTAVNPANGLSAVAKVGPSNTLYFYWQLSGGSWAGPIGVSGGGTAYSDPSMVVNPSTGLESVAVQGPGNTTYLYWQLSSGSWAGPIGVSGGGTDFASPSMQINPSTGLLSIADEGPGNTIYYYWQLSSGSWAGPIGVSGGGTAYSSPSMTLDPSSGLESVAVQGPSNTIYYYWQLSSGAWNGPIGIAGGSTSFSAPSVGVNPANGLRSLSVIGPNNVLYFYWQLSGGSWAGPLGLGW